MKVVQHECILFFIYVLVKSFVELGKMLLRERQLKYLLSEKFFQDPLEEHFARHRRSGGCNDNPSLDQLKKQEVMLSVIRSELISDLRGNTSGCDESHEPIRVEDTRLPRRRKIPRRNSEETLDGK